MDDNYDHNEIDVPQYFLCPISLQIMKDPVTTTTGITYDRQSIRHWLSKAEQPICPVTKQPLKAVSGDLHLTPNTTLLRLIQAWSVTHGVDRVPTPKAPLTRGHVSKILRGLNAPHMMSTSLDQLLSLATSDNRVHDRRVMVDSGVVKRVVCVVIKCHVENRRVGVEQAIRILNDIWIPDSDLIKRVVEEYFDKLIDAVTWIINDIDEMKNLGVVLAKHVVKVTNSNLIERLKPEFFKGVVKIIRQAYNSNNNINNNPHGNNEDAMVGPTKAAIRVLLEVCQHRRNRYRIIESGVIFELIELELNLDLDLNLNQRKKLTELGFCLLAQLCNYADGRAQLMAHGGGMAMVAKRMMRVSEMVDDTAVQIIGQISKYSAAKETAEEMLRIGVVWKMCMVLQSNRAKYLKDKVRDILRMHSYVWNNDSPCIQLCLLSI